jgi:ketosteroid isomerase-like protein
VSRGNVEVVRQTLRAFGLRDAELAGEVMAPDVEWEPATPAALEGEVYRGAEQVTAAAQGLWELWEEFRFEETEIREQGDSIVWLGHAVMKGSGSQVELRQEFGIHFELRDGKVARARARLSWAEALELAGLEE